MRRFGRRQEAPDKSPSEPGRSDDCFRNDDSYTSIFRSEQASAKIDLIGLRIVVVRPVDLVSAFNCETKAVRSEGCHGHRAEPGRK